MTKRIIAALTCLVLMLCLTPFGVLADEADGKHTSHDGWTQWTSTNSLPSNSGKYVLMNDVALTTVGAQLESVEITLCLNGHTVDQTGVGEYDRIYRINGATELTICDCTAKTADDGAYTAGKMINGKNSCFLFDGKSEATLNIYGGIFSGHKAQSGGFMVIQGKSTFNMYGGEVSGNTADLNGGAIFAAPTTTLNLVGGTIKDNTCSGEGAGVYTMSSNCNMEDGFVVSGNSGCYKGAGVMVANGNFYMHGGTITGNTSKDGAGVFVNIADGKSPNFEMTGGTIAGNTATNEGGGVYVGNSGNMKLLGGTIKENTAAASAGGVCISGNCFVTLGDVTITGNTGVSAGGVHFALGSLTLSGKPMITDNKTAAGKTINFLYEAQRGSVVKAEGLEADAKIGVTLYPNVEQMVISGVTAENAACFVGDNGATWELSDKGLNPVGGSVTQEQEAAPEGKEEQVEETKASNADKENKNDSKKEDNKKENNKPSKNNDKESTSVIPTSVILVLAVAALLSVAIVIVIFKM